MLRHIGAGKFITENMGHAADAKLVLDAASGLIEWNDGNDPHRA